MTLPTKAGRQRGRVLAWIAGGLALVLLLLAIATYSAWRTEAGARLLWSAAQRFAPGRLEGELVGGTLAEGLRVRGLRYQDAQRTLAIDSIDAAWDLSLSPLALRIDRLHVGTVDLTRQPGPSEPATMPPSLRLPFALDLRDARVREIITREAGSEDATRLRDLRLQAGSDGVQHRVRLHRLETDAGSLRADLSLNGDAPFPLAGSVGLDGRVREQDMRVDARLSGSLQALRIDADGGAGKLAGHARIEATPFAPVPLQRAQVRVDDFDPRALNPAWPRAQLSLRADLKPEGPAPELGQLVVSGPVSLENAAPGAIDKDLVPLVSARAEVRLDAQKQRLDALDLRLAGGGAVEGSGELRAGGSGEFALRAQALDLQALHGSLRPTRLAGPLSLTLDGANQSVSLELADKTMRVTAEADLTPALIRVQSAQLQAGDARLDLQGRMERAGNGSFAASGKLQEFDPARFAAQMQPKAGGKRPKIPEARINMDFEAEGALRPELRAELRFDIDDSSYAGLPMEGGGTLRVAGERLLPSDLALQIAGNEVQLKGSFGAPGERVRFDVDAPALERLGYGLAGRLRLEGDAAGTPQRPQVNARYNAENLSFGEHSLASLKGEASMQGLPAASPDALIDLDLSARGLRSGGIALATLSADLDGSYASHTLSLDGEGRLNGQPLSLRLGARGRLRDTAQGLAWDGTLRTLENRTEPRIALTAPMPLAVAPGRVEAGSGQLTVAQAKIELRSLLFDQGRVQSAGSIAGLDVGSLLRLQQQFTGDPAPVSTNLVLDGSWDLSLAETGAGYLQIERRSGDVSIPGAVGERTLGLGLLRLRADLQGDSIVFDGGADASRIGSLRAEGRLQLQQSEGRLAFSPDAPLSARIRAEVPRLQSIAALAGPRIALDGRVAADIAVAGSAGDPRITGSVNGERLALTLYDQGVRLRDGTARLAIADNVVQLQEVLFHGGDGTLRATGSIGIGDAGRGLSAQIVADRLQLLASPTGRLTVSGQATAAETGGQTVVSGKFVVDRALFSLPEKSAPSLSDDVVVIRRDRPQQARQERPEDRRASPLSPRIDVAVDLGRNFRFEGSGAELRLAGVLNIRSAPNETPQAYGTVRVAEGTYEAFGAELEIERGLINFQGPLANPNLNILAMRREQEVEAGVQITGTVQQPRVQLVSEPAVSDEEKLSWLIFGRGGGGTEQGQARAAAQGAALGLLNKFGGSRVAKGLGLDELSIGSSEFGLEGGQVVNLGKEITDRLFVGYEQSLAGAESVLKLTYQLSRSWTVVVRGGAVTGLDLFYSKRFDGDREDRARGRAGMRASGDSGADEETQ